MPLTEQAVRDLESILQKAVGGEEPGVPGTTFVVVGRDGGELFAQAAGRRGIAAPEPMSLENVYWIASCTKMLTGLACMQLVEKGLLSLDDAAQTEGLCPELGRMQVLQEDGSLRDKKNGITLRMLLTHTAGFGYTFFNERLRDWPGAAGLDEFSGNVESITKLPLVFEPGEGWQYGVRTP